VVEQAVLPDKMHKPILVQEAVEDLTTVVAETVVLEQ
jgi:hypothetical protein